MPNCCATHASRLKTDFTLMDQFVTAVWNISVENVRKKIKPMQEKKVCGNNDTFPEFTKFRRKKYFWIKVPMK